MDGRGTRIRLSKSTILHLLSHAHFTLSANGKDAPKESEELTPGETMEWAFEDILYYRKHEKNGKVDLKYNTMTNYSVFSDEFDSYCQKHKGFCKGLIWFYEKETRLLVKLKGSAADSVIKKLEQIKKGTVKYMVTLSLENVYSRLNIDFGPEIVSLDDCWHTSTGDQMDGIRDFIYTTSHTHLSSYTGTIQMNLCKKCNRISNN